jgi:hypothetical protein
MASAAVAGAVAIYTGLTLPPAARTLDTAIPPTVVFGAYHVHSTRSDGTGTIDEIATAAAGAGLSFVVFTDHGNGTRPPDPPSYRHGVLCLDAVEISTFAGHLVALGLTTGTPYPLAGDARDVIEDVHRLGGRAIVAHPDSAKADQRWRAWETPLDGLEWINADSEWRDDSGRRLITAALHSIVRPAEAVTSLFERPARTLERWDRAAANRAVVGLAAVDAHASIGLRESDEPRGRSLLARPSYAAMFRTLQQAAVLDAPLTGDARVDAAAVVTALQSGRTFSLVRSLAGPAALQFTATRDGVVTPMGGRLGGAGGEVVIEAATTASDAQLVLLHQGRRLAGGSGRVRQAGPLPPGAYRVEAYLRGSSVPWIVSNPIYLGDVAPGDPPDPAAGEAGAPSLALDSRAEWRVEKDARSQGTAAADAGEVRLTYALGAGAPAGQYAALVTDVVSEEGFDRLSFTGRASAPMRLSVQLRLLGNSDQRWRRSVYLDQTPRLVTIDVAEFEPIEPSSLRPNIARVRAVLLVVDTLNTAPGARGDVSVRDIALRVGRPR